MQGLDMHWQPTSTVQLVGEIFLRVVVLNSMTGRVIPYATVTAQFDEDNRAINMSYREGYFEGVMATDNLGIGTHEVHVLAKPLHTETQRVWLSSRS